MSEAHEKMAAAINEAIPEQGEFIPSELAAKLVASVQGEAWFEEWLRDYAVVAVTDLIGQRLRYARVRARNQAQAQGFGKAAEAFEGGELSAFEQWFEVDETHTRRLLRDMTGADHLFVAENYGSEGRHALMQEAFHRAVAKKVGKRRTEDVLSEEQYRRLYRSITQQKGAAA